MSRKAPVDPMLAAAIGCICFFAVLGFALPSLAAPVDEKAVLLEVPVTAVPPVGVKVSGFPGSGLKLEKKWPELGCP